VKLIRLLISNSWIYKRLFLILLIISISCINKTDKSWEKSDLKWKQFSVEHMERMRKNNIKLIKFIDSNLINYNRWIPIINPTLSKLFPEYKFYYDTHYKFTINKNGTITALNKDFPLKEKYETAPDLIIMSMEDFLKKNIKKVNNSKDAIEITKVADILKFVGGQLYVDDWYYIHKDWEWTAIKNNLKWDVSRKYIGPPASIILPPTWKIKVDIENNFISIESRNKGFGRSKAGIIRIVMENLTSLKNAYNRKLKGTPNMSGKIEVRFGIDQFGKVVYSHLHSSSVNDELFEDEIVSKVSEFKFDTIAAPSDTIEIVYPFVFTPDNNQSEN
jgi:hypothetical protein